MQAANDLPDLFAALAHSVAKNIHADACLISLLDEERDVLRDVAASVIAPARLNTVAMEYRLSEFPMTRAVLEKHNPREVSIHDPDADPAERAVLDDLGFRRVLLCPLIVEDRAIGTVECYRTVDRGFRKDDPDQVAFLAAFAANTYSRIQLAAKLESHYTVTLEALASALEAKDPNTEAHTGRIRDMALALSTAMQVPPELRRAVKLGAILHDVGKIGIADAILLKPGPLDDEEWQVMRQHPLIGERMLQGIDFVAPALPIVRHHHERWDGNGYPDRLTKDEIPLGARIVAVCDAFDAMTSDRPYRKGMPMEHACDELISCAGKQFDPMCVALLVDVVSRLGQDHLEERFVRYAT
jgi:HD domain/GAF domain